MIVAIIPRIVMTIIASAMVKAAAEAPKRFALSKLLELKLNFTNGDDALVLK